MVKQISPALYPFDGKFTEVNGRRMHYLDEGNGPAVVMVHGNPTWSFYYREVVKALSPTMRCVVPDHIGCGYSEKPSADQYPYTLERRVDDLEALLDQLGLDRQVTLIAHDWGGMIGMAMAHRRPERIARIVLMNTGAFPLPSTKRMPSRLSLVRDSPVGAFLVTRFNAFARGATFMAVEKRLPKAVADAYVAPYDTPDNRIATLRFVQDIPLKPDDPGYAIVDEVGRELSVRFGTTPTLLVWGARDWVFDDHFLRGFQTRLPHAETLRIADAGHYVLEDAKDVVLTRIQRFLSEHPLDPAAPPAEGA